MTSTRLMLPGATPSRAQLWRRQLFGSVPGRAALIGAAVKAVTTILGWITPGASVVEALDAFGSLALLFAGGYALTRGIIWAKRRLLWRVRRKLILSYIFVGLVPGLLIIAFFLIAGLILFFNVSTYLLQSRVRTLVDQADFLAESVALQAAHGDPVDTLRRTLVRRQASAAERFPYTSIAIVPVEKLQCPSEGQANVTVPPVQPMTVGPWQHLDPPARVPQWVPCDGFTGIIAYEGSNGQSMETRLVMRAVALPQSASPQWAVIVDLPFTVTIEERLREETGIRLGAATALPSQDARIAIPRGRLLENRLNPEADATSAFGEGWVAFFDVRDWARGATYFATIAIQLNVREIYDRVTALSAQRQFGQLLLLILAFLGVLFLTIQFVAFVIGFVLARQITGAVHDLFTGTEHLRNRNFMHQIPVRARDQLGELAESFNVMTGEVTKLLKENADKARMEQEMLAAREIQQRLLPSGPLSVPGLSIHGVLRTRARSGRRLLRLSPYLGDEARRADRRRVGQGSAGWPLHGAAQGAGPFAGAHASIATRLPQGNQPCGCRQHRLEEFHHDVVRRDRSRTRRDGVGARRTLSLDSHPGHRAGWTPQGRGPCARWARPGLEDRQRRDVRCDDSGGFHPAGGR